MQRPAEVYVWDPFVRLFHWSLVTCVLLNQFVLEEGETAHEWTGYTAAALVGLRLLWGLVGTRHARLSDWWPTPARVRAHVGALLAGQPDEHPGHNPLGALMMLLLMALVLLLALTGWLQGTDALFGEEWVEELHEGLANTLLVAAGVHAAAALVMGRLHRVHLVRAMITGVKRYD
ncbi:MAG: cytochrome b/b6 domain-containing protein [Tepidimonas ignava]|nr:cytochrome b/b6 domain-containing protein [Tepidimonas ignava]